MSEYLMVPFLPDSSCLTGELGLSEDDCADLVNLNWVEWIDSKISYWHPYIMRLNTKEETPIFYCLTEENDWEGEVWYHYFLDSPGVYDILSLLQEDEANDFTELETVIVTWPEAERLTNQDHGGYMQEHWFGKLTRLDELRQATNPSHSRVLYKGGIREFGEELFTYESTDEENVNA